jgi:hypothetical protein
MSTSSWELDPARNEYYYFSKQENAYVYQSGHRVLLTASSPPPPPPKNSSGLSTPKAVPPKPPPPPTGQNGSSNTGGDEVIKALAQLRPPEEGWLPDILRDKSYARPRHLLKHVTFLHSVGHPTYTISSQRPPCNMPSSRLPRHSIQASQHPPTTSEPSSMQTPT